MMKIFLICIFGILLALPAAGQRTQQRIAVGDDFFEKQQFEEAIDVYERVLRREDDPRIRRELSFKVGESYRRLLNYKEARKWYNIALNLGYEDPEVHLHLGEMSLGLEEFDTAIRHIEEFLKIKPDHELGIKLQESAYFARENYFTETIFEASNEAALSNRGQQWGTAFLENVPVVYDDQQKVDEQFDIDIRLRYNNIFYWVWMSRTLKERIVFSSTQPYNGDSEGYSSIYQATFNRREGDWDRPDLLQGGINSDYYDGFLSFDDNNQIAYFMNSGGMTGERATADIYTVPYDDQTDTWGIPVIFPFNDDDFNIGYPSISEDGRTLYFASDMEEGFGGYDIYKIEKDDNGNWGEPVNLGETINTPFNDSYPFIAGDVLYFSSYGHPGFGGFDIFYSIIDEEGNYTSPVNMGAPVNSSADDFGFIIDEDYSQGFFSSNRPGGSGEDDIYSFRVVPKTFMVFGTVADEITGEPIQGLDLFFFDDFNNFFVATTDQNGFYQLEELSTDVNYYINAYPENYPELADTLAVKDQLLASRFTVITEYEKNFNLIPEEAMIAEEEPGVTEEDLISFEEITSEEDAIEEDFSDVMTEETPEEVAVAEKEPAPEPIKEETPQPVEEVITVAEPEPAHTIFTLSDEGFPVIYFEFGKAQLTDTAINQLDTIVNFLKTNPEKGILVHAHTDVISSYLFNFYLSQQRAQSIWRYLRRQNIDISRVLPIGHGKTNLAISNALTDEEHRLNRRATFESIPLEELSAYMADVSRSSFRYLNSIEKEAHFAEGIEFMVQFMASHVPISPQYYRKIMDNLPEVDIIYYYDADRYHRYLAGSFRNFFTVFDLQRELRQMGYEIYIVAFKDGERIPVSRARRLTGEL